MAQTIRMFLKKDYASSKDGAFPIIFIVDQKKINTGQWCEPNAWNQDSQSVNNKFKYAAVTNAALKRGSIILEEILKHETDIKKVRGIYKKYLGKSEYFFENKSELFVKEPEPIPEPAPKISDADFFSNLVDEIINERIHFWSKAYRRKIGSVRNDIINMDPEFAISKFSLAWAQKYVDYCYAKDNDHNGIASKWRIILVLCEIIKEKKEIPIDKSTFDFKMVYFEPKIQPLHWPEVKRIAELDLSSPENIHMEDSRYIWVLCAYLGQRWRDIKRTDKNNFNQRQIESKGVSQKLWFYNNTAQKSKRKYSIPLLDEAVEWLQKRDFNPPKVDNSKVNRDIKVLAKMAGLTEDVKIQKFVKDEVIDVVMPRWETVHIHTARHTYAVELVKRYINRPFWNKFVSEMLGHASLATLEKYTNFVESQKDKIFIDFIRENNVNTSATLKLTIQIEQAEEGYVGRFKEFPNVKANGLTERLLTERLLLSLQEEIGAISLEIKDGDEKYIERNLLLSVA